MDLVGIGMGIVTIPMALLTIAGLVGGLALAATGDWTALAIGTLALGIGVIVAALMERVVSLFDGVASGIARRHGRAPGLWVGGIGAVLPMLVILAWEWAALAMFWAGGAAHAGWAYLIATGPWTLFATREDGDRRTLSAIRAYAAHLSFWVLIAMRAAGLAPLAPLAMLVPAILPIAVGTLLAVADREALRNIRI